MSPWGGHRSGRFQMIGNRQRHDNVAIVFQISPGRVTTFQSQTARYAIAGEADLARVALRQLFAGGAVIHRDGDEAAIADEVDENFQPGRHGTPR
jgi:hypothetical protein